MAWIKVIQEGEATGRLKALYEKYEEPWGGVDEILKLSRQYDTTYSYDQLEVKT